jgi:hypothetical protein
VRIIRAVTEGTENDLLHPSVLWAGIGLMVVIAAVVLLTMRLLRHWL